MLGEFRLGWITNTRKDEAEKVACELLAGHKKRAIFIGNPKPTDTYTKQQLIEMGIVGLYDCHPESINQLRGFKDIVCTPPSE